MIKGEKILIGCILFGIITGIIITISYSYNISTLESFCVYNETNYKNSQAEKNGISILNAPEWCKNTNGKMLTSYFVLCETINIGCIAGLLIIYKQEKKTGKFTKELNK